MNLCRWSRNRQAATAPPRYSMAATATDCTPEAARAAIRLIAATNQTSGAPSSAQREPTVAPKSAIADLRATFRGDSVSWQADRCSKWASTIVGQPGTRPRRRCISAWSAAWCGCFVALTTAWTAEASPSDLFGLGSRSQGMAATGASHETGFAATYLNPAMLSRTPQRRLALGAASTLMSLDATWATPDQAPFQSLDDDTEALVFGVTAPLPLPAPVEDRLVLGLGVSTPGSTIARVDIAAPTQPRFPLVSSRAESLSFNLGVGARLSSELTVGVGTMLLASLEGSVALDAGGDGTARSLTDDQLVLTQAPLVGVAYSPTDELSAALVWHSELRSDFDMVVTVNDLGSLVIPDLNVVGLAQVDPAQLVAEASYRTESWTAAFGLAYKRWSNIDGFAGATVRCPAQRPDCDAPSSRSLGLRDIWVPRVALERAVKLPGATALIRAGYFYEPSPLPAASSDLRVFDNPRHALTAGYGLDLGNAPASVALGIAAQYHVLVEREHPTTPTTVRTSGNVWSIAFDAEVTF